MTMDATYPVPNTKTFCNAMLIILKHMRPTNVCMAKHLHHTARLFQRIKNHSSDDTMVDVKVNHGVLECRTYDKKLAATYQFNLEYIPYTNGNHADHMRFAISTQITVTNTSVDKKTLIYRSNSHTFIVDGMIRSEYAVPYKTTEYDLEQWIKSYLTVIQTKMEQVITHPISDIIITQQAGKQKSHPYSL